MLEIKKKTYYVPGTVLGRIHKYDQVAIFK